MDAHAAGVGAFPLRLATPGEHVRVIAFRGGRELSQRLIDLGLALGSTIVIHQVSPGGAMIIARGDGRLALGAGMSHRVLVQRVDDPDGSR
jgi:ferrous iron transport protein A